MRILFTLLQCTANISLEKIACKQWLWHSILCECWKCTKQFRLSSVAGKRRLTYQTHITCAVIFRWPHQYHSFLLPIWFLGLRTFLLIHESTESGHSHMSKMMLALNSKEGQYRHFYALNIYAEINAIPKRHTISTLAKSEIASQPSIDFGSITQLLH